MASAGADELIDLIMRLFLEPNDAIVNCPPTFGMYGFDAEVNGAHVITVSRNADFSLDLDAIQDVVRAHHPKLLFLASPNNPDGGLLPAEALERLLALPLVVVLDEAYVEFAPPGSSRLRDVAMRENLIVLRTFSKWAGLAGLRIGYGVFPEAFVPMLMRAKQPYNVSVAAEQAAVVTMQNFSKADENIAQIIEHRDQLYEALEQIAWLMPYPSQANFILCRVEGVSAFDVKQRLRKQGILIRYFDKPGLSDHVRISIGTQEQTEKLITALKGIW